MTRTKRYKIRLVRKWQQVGVGDPISRFGTGMFVDVLRLRGGRIKLVSHDSGPRNPQGALLLTPYQPNHGLIVKYIDKNGKSPFTGHLTFADIYQAVGGKPMEGQEGADE